jgi:putative SOS response-associated peptidase YedK
MCGRYTLTYHDLGEVAELLGAILDPGAIRIHHPRYNVAPTNPCVVAAVVAASGASGPAIVPATWGFHLSGRLVINVRGETVAARFPGAFAHGRCVVPADGFYEWTGGRADRRPVWFHGPEGRPLFMAGLLHHEEPGAPPAFAVLTTPARPPVAGVHERMPVLLGAERARAWLLAPPPAVRGDDVALVATEVSPRVNTAAHDDPDCLLPPDAARDASEKRGQLGLF